MTVSDETDAILGWKYFNPILGGGGGFRPPSGFSRAIAKRLEIGSSKFVTFKGHSLRTFCEILIQGQVRSADPP